MNIQFEKASHKHQAAIFAWLEEPHIKEFWDNSQNHKDDIVNFIQGRKQPSNYAQGLYSYWVGLMDDQPYSLLMTIQENPSEQRPPIKNAHLSKTGTTYSMEYMIGDKNYFDKGLGAKTLSAFIDFFHKEVDPSADTFFIDPDISNSRAKHVYEKAGFEYIGDFIMAGDGVFAGRKTHFLLKQIKPTTQCISIKNAPHFLTKL